MFFPIGDQPNPPGVPAVTWLLIAVNVAVHVLVVWPLSQMPVDPADPALGILFDTVSRAHPEVAPRVLAAQLLREATAQDTFFLQWGFLPGAPSATTLLSAMFLHSGWLHLAGNMLFLWIYGDNVEHRLGKVRYLFAYLLSGAAATLAFAAFVAPENGAVPLVGASGAISGVLGFYFVWFPRNKVRVFIMLFPFLVDVWLIGARVVLGIYVVLDNMLPFLLGAGGGVAYGAHLGGFFAGALGAVVIDGWARARGRQAGASIGDEVGTGVTSEKGDARAVIDAVARGSTGYAIARLTALSPAARREIDAEILADLGDALLVEHARAAQWVFETALREQPRSKACDRLWLGLGRALLLPPSHPTSAYQAFVRALECDPRPEVAAQAQQHLREIAGLQRGRFVVPRTGGRQLW